MQHYLIVWPDEPRIVLHSRDLDNSVATEVFTAGPVALDPPGITVTVEGFYAECPG